jgi:hypothetical protein
MQYAKYMYVILSLIIITIIIIALLVLVFLVSFVPATQIAGKHGLEI